MSRFSDESTAVHALAQTGTWAPVAREQAPVAEPDAPAGLHNQVVLYRGRSFTLVNFGVFAALGGALVALLALARQHQAGLPTGRLVWALWLPAILSVLVGSYLFVLALDWRELVRAPLERLKKPGFAFQGGLIAVIGTVLVGSWALGTNTLLLFDTLALALPFGHAVGRIGCHTYGCCHGRPTGSRFAVTYTNPQSKVVWGSQLGGTPLLPTQLMSCAANVALFFFLALVALAEVRVGQLSGLYLVLAGAGRFLNEFLRGIPVRKRLGLSPFQWVSLAQLACGVAMLAAVAGSPTHALFATGFSESLVHAMHAYWYVPALYFVVLFAGFGVHGRVVGRWS